MRRFHSRRVRCLLAGAVLAALIFVAAPLASSGSDLEASQRAPDPRGDRTAERSAAAGAVPPAGGLTTTIAGVDDPRALVDELPFDVAALGIFDIQEQQYLTYVPGAPHHVNAAFRHHLHSEQIVWVRRAADDTSRVEWDDSPLLSEVNGPRGFGEPRPGGLTAGVSGTDSIEQLIDAQPFSVASVSVFDVSTQRFHGYVPGSPAYADTLTGSGLLGIESVVWLRRDTGDTTDISDRRQGPRFAAIGDGGEQSGSEPVADPHSTSPAPANLLRHLTYEDEGSTREEEHVSTDHGLGITNGTARAGSYSGFARLEPDDPKWREWGYRAEWHGMDHIAGPGTERWHGISYYFPRDYDRGSNSRTFDDRIIFQFTDEGSPMFSLHIDEDDQALWLRRKDQGGDFHTLGRWSFDTERWYDIAFHAVWEKDDSGVFEVYVDGVRQVSYEGRTLAVRNETYSKWGIYGQPTYLLFDEVRIAEGANQLDAVTP